MNQFVHLNNSAVLLTHTIDCSEYPPEPESRWFVESIRLKREWFSDTKKYHWQISNKLYVEITLNIQAKEEIIFAKCILRDRPFKFHGPYNGVIRRSRIRLWVSSKLICNREGWEQSYNDQEDYHDWEIFGYDFLGLRRATRPT
ncbi:hypothetical protein QAD02_004953 [Eretmocerus hayati]|uniref:Uncharacterized protein n=1 Tax=Eretmocerus hayati TaxID=131215 RepID=A0ACC2NSX2_9HYME|nr:hypothetical protein QAD02_004953 [Eretmocerus hayati]